MKVFWITLFLTFILSKLAQYTGIKSNHRIIPNKFLFFLVVAILVLVAGLRSGIGDTGTYRDLFERTDANFIGYLKQAGELTEFGFWISMAFIKQFISNDSQVFIFIYALITIVLITWRLYKEAEPLDLSMYLFITMGCYLVVMNGMRQYLAAALLFAAFPLIQQRKWHIYIPIVLLASTIHTSAIIFVPLYFILNAKPWGTVTYGLIIMGVFLYVTYGTTGPMIANILNETQYGHYSEALISKEGGANIIRAAVAIVPLLLSYFCKNRIAKNEKYGGIVVNASVLYFIFTLLANKYWIYARFNIYFNLFAIILTCYDLKYAFTKSSRELVYVLCILLFGVYYYYEMVISLGMTYSSAFF